MLGGIASAIGSGINASKNRKWMRKNYKNRYQWTMQDMKRAGLNPMLAYSQGVGGNIGAPPMADFSGLAKVDETVAKHRELGQKGPVAKAQAGNLDANTGKAVADTGQSQAATMNLIQSKATSAAQERNINADTVLKMRGRPWARAMGALDESIVKPGLDYLRKNMGSAKEQLNIIKHGPRLKGLGKGNGRYDIRTWGVPHSSSRKGKRK